MLGICPHCGKQNDLRPYGPNGSDTCFECAMSTPERKAEAERQFAALFDKHGGPLVVGDGEPRGLTYEEAVMVDDVLNVVKKP